MIDNLEKETFYKTKLDNFCTIPLKPLTILQDYCICQHLVLTIDDIREDVADALEDFEYPAQIIQLPERPFFHYKTNRVGLKAQLRATTN